MTARGRISTSGGRREEGGAVFFAAFVSESFFNHEHEYKTLLCKNLQVLIYFYFFGTFYGRIGDRHTNQASSLEPQHLLKSEREIEDEVEFPCF